MFIIEFMVKQVTLNKLEKTAEQLPFHILDKRNISRLYDLELYESSTLLADFVELFWVMRWDMQGDAVEAEVIPSAYTNLTCMGEGARITGVTTGVYRYEITGSGTIFGAMFKPGGLHPFIKRPLKDLTDSYIDAVTIFKEITPQFNQRVLSFNNLEGLSEIINLLNQYVIEDGKVDLINQIIDSSVAAKSSVKGIASEFGLSERSLQSLFEKYVGVGLKWIVLRDRLQKATLIADTAQKVDWTDVAYNLGYYDQSHFINDFKRIIGMTPKQYTKNLSEEK